MLKCFRIIIAKIQRMDWKATILLHGNGKRLMHKSWYEAGDVKQDELFITLKQTSVKLTDLSTIPWNVRKDRAKTSYIRRNKNARAQNSSSYNLLGYRAKHGTEN